jgi:hypothetical protein
MKEEGRRKKEGGRRKKEVLRWGFRPQLKTGDISEVGVLKRTARIKITILHLQSKIYLI